MRITGLGAAPVRRASRQHPLERNEPVLLQVQAHALKSTFPVRSIPNAQPCCPGVKRHKKARVLTASSWLRIG